MPEGLLVTNDANFIQIDSLFKNHRLTQQGTISMPAPTVVGSEWFPNPGSTFITAINPVLAYRCAGAWAVVSMIRTISATTFKIEAVSDAAAPVDFYVFDDVPPTSSNFGLQVFDTGGNQVYDSNDQSLRVLDVFNQGSVLVGSDVQRSYGGRKVAVVTSGVIRFIRALSTTLQESMALGCKTIGTDVLSHRFATVRRANVGVAQNYISTRAASRLVVDVTGF